MGPQPFKINESTSLQTVIYNKKKLNKIKISNARIRTKTSN